MVRDHRRCRRWVSGAGPRDRLVRGITDQLLAAAMSIPVAVLIVWAVMEAIDIFLNRLSDPFDQSVAAEEARRLLLRETKR